MNIGTWLACVLYYWVSFYDSTTHISTCSVESHLVKDTSQVSDLVLQVALEVVEVRHQIQKLRVNTDKQDFNTWKTTQSLRNSAVSSSGVARFPRWWYL